MEIASQHLASPAHTLDLLMGTTISDMASLWCILSNQDLNLGKVTVFVKVYVNFFSLSRQMTGHELGHDNNLSNSYSFAIHDDLPI
jgi:hypothetical protein